MKTVTLTEEEYSSICMLAYNNARQEGEDVIGVLMKNGAFRILNHESERGLVDLSHKVETGREKYLELLEAQLAIEKEKNRQKRIQFHSDVV